MHTTFPLFAAALQESGLFSEIPHDPASIVIYLLIIGSVGWVIRSGMKKGTPRQQ